MSIRTTLLLLFLCTSAQAGIYHATPSGAGSHTGADLANAVSFTEAMYSSPGDTIWLRTGTYPYVFSPENPGAAGSPIVYEAYPGETVTLTGAADGSPQVVVVPTNYIELHGVKVITAENPSGNSSYMVDLTGDHIVFRNNEVTYSGDVVSSYNSSGYRTRGIVLAGAYVTVDSNYVRGMCEGIASSGGSPRYHVIRGNTVNASAWNGLLQLATTDGTTDFLGVLWEGNDVDTCYGEDCLQFQQNYDGTVDLNRNRGTVVRNNRFRRAGENLIDLKGAGRVVIEGNVMFTADGDDEGAFAGDQPWSGPGIERGNPAQGVEDRYTTVRGNVIGDASSGRTMATIGSQDANNLYINNRRRLNVSNTSDSTIELKGILVEGNDDKPRMILNDLFVGQPNWVNLYLYNMDNRSERFDLDHNLYYDSAEVERFYHRKTSGTTAKVYGLAAWKTALSNSDYSYLTGREQHSLNSNPLFTDMPLRAYGYNPSWDWSLAAGSPAIGSARCWAFTTASGTGATIPVSNAYIWSDGFGIVQGDSVKIGSNTATYITSSNPASGTITVAASQTYSSGDSVYFVVNGGVLRNLGPYNVASVAGGGDPGAPPDAPTNVAPANGTSTTSPVTLRWTSEAGASSYYLCVSPDGWNTLIVSQSALTDTFYTVSLPQGGSYIWNVSASNAYGRSSWSSDWVFTTTIASTWKDTVTLNWNNIKHSQTLDTNTAFQFSNLQRRDIQVALRNPNGKEVSWIGVTWITAQPPIIPPAQSWYQFFWDGGDSILGSYINNSSIATLSWGSIVGSISENAALTSTLSGYVRKASGVLFVSPAFSGMSSPYYADVAAAVTAASTGSVIYISPGAYTGGFTVGVDNLTIIGESPAEFQSSDSTFSGGVLINGTCSGGGKRNFTLQNVTIAKRDAAGDVYTCGSTGSSKINHTYINCRFVGTSWGNGYHAFLAQAGSHITVRDCKTYRSTHGFAIRASYVSMSGIYTEDCGSESAIIIKAATGSGSAEYVTLTDFTVTATVAGRARGVIVLCSNTGVRTSQVNITNGVVYGTASAGVYVLQDAGSVSDVTVTGVNVRKSGTSSFWVNSGSRVSFINCMSDSATNYGFLNSSGSDVAVAGCRVNASTTYSGSFTTEIAGALQVFGTVTFGAANVTGDVSVSGWVSLDSILYMKRGISLLNIAGTDWLAFLVRNTSGSEAVYDMDYIGNIVTRNLTANLFNTNATTVNFAGAANRINIGKSGDSVHVLGNLWAGGYDPVYGKYPLGVNGTSFLFGTVYIKDDTWLGTYNGSSAGVKYTQSTGTVTHRATRFALSTIQTAPSSATDTGTAGEYRITATGIYICTATNTWVRAVAATW